MSHPLRTAALIAAGCALFAAGFLYREYAGSDAKAAARDSAQRYTCPMHPHYVSDHPGDAPCCGMRLVPVGSSVSTIPNSVTLTAGQQQIGGVQTEAVAVSDLREHVRTTGRVIPDESRVHNVVANTDGWIRRVSTAATTGSLIRKGDLLAAIYSKELLQSQQAFLFTSRAMESVNAESGAQVVAQVRTAHEEARAQLENGGLTGAQIESLKQSQTPAVETELLAPAHGLLLSRNVTAGQRLERGTELFRIADVSRVWVQADFFEKEARLLKTGATVRVRHGSLGFSADARIADILPQFDPQTRTLKLRLEVDNPDLVLRPDMFVDVEFDIRLPAALSVPADAVMDTGLKKTVFVDRGQGIFEQREVVTGARAGGRVAIIGGLRAGDRIVTAGNFLLDSESRMHHSAVRKVEPGTAIDPVCGMTVRTATAKYKTARGDGFTYFCSEQCMLSHR